MVNSGIISFLSDYSWYDSAISWLSELIGFDVTTTLTFLVYLLFAAIVVGGMSLVGGLGTYAERKISADLQARVGPNRVGPYGILQFLADGVKMITKEDIIPADADKFLFTLAPALCLIGVFATFAVLPFSSGFTLTHLNLGVFYLVAVSSLVGLGVFLGGYASNSKWSMLGGMRGVAQIVSYEIPVVISILAIILLSGGLSFTKIIEGQSGTPFGWYIFNGPFTFLAFFVYFIGALAETNRAPFDLPEAESELVSGYHTEYSGMRFGFFALAEYMEIFVVCGVGVSLFLGGYQIPYNLFAGTIWAQLLQLIIFFSKTFLLYYAVIWVRWTLPRLRVDQLMSLCWKYLIPIALFNLIGQAVWVAIFDGRSIYQIFLHHN